MQTALVEASSPARSKQQPTQTSNVLIEQNGAIGLQLACADCGAVLLTGFVEERVAHCHAGLAISHAGQCPGELRGWRRKYARLRSKPVRLTPALR